MKTSKKTATLMSAGVLIAGAADLVIHREKIRRSMRGQQQHYATKDRGVLSRFAHAYAAKTWTGRALGSVAQALLSEKQETRS